MPFQVGSVAVHDDGQHTGSAKRDAASGVAGLDAGGDVLAIGANIELTRNGSGDISIIERTSGETVAVMRRTGANAYTLYNNTTAGGKIIQDSSMKNVAGGIAGLDANLKLGLECLPGLNLLSVLNENTMTDTINTGTITRSLVLGTLEVRDNAGGSGCVTQENGAVALSAASRVWTWKIATWSVSNSGEIDVFLFNSAGGNHIGIVQNLATATFAFQTRAASVMTSTTISVAAGDVVQIVATTAKVSLFVNNVHVASHTTNIPTVALSFRVYAGAGGAVAATCKLSYMSDMR